jgi:anaerobic selenocysteine-containing dehydrogenase
MSNEWQQTACILCNQTCGIEVKLEGRHLARVRGDKSHVMTRGYACEKAQRLDYYQNGRDRLTSPLRRRRGGGFEAIDWDTAIREIAEKFVRIRATYGGDTIFYYGGGGQGNHLGGAYGAATRRALGSVYSSNALAQEKTGEFWVDGHMFGGHTAPDFEHAEVAMFIGKNPWQSHGFPRARVVLREISADPGRALIVIDPRRTETAAIADYHLQVRPGTDAFCISAILGVLLQEDLINHGFIRAHVSNEDEVVRAGNEVPVADYCARCGVAEETVRAVARRIARAQSVSILEDLGIQMAPHSTLNSYLEKLIFVLTGNFAKPGAMNLHSSFGRLSSGKRAGAARKSPVGGHRIISGLIPCNVIPDEILSDHPKRFRAMLIESANPVHSLADSQRMRAALDALELVVVIDVALTETAHHADYILPAPSQFEKCEATFFTLEFPNNYFSLRAPILDAAPGTLPEPEIHRRLVRALGAYTDEDIAPLHRAAAKSRAVYATELLRLSSERPQLAALVPVTLYETLGPTLPRGMEGAAIVWGLAQSCARDYPESVRRAGFAGEGFALGEALFEGILNSRSGVCFSIDPYEETWRRLGSADGRINAEIPELLDEFRSLRDEKHAPNPDFPFVLMAGARSSTTANTIIRDPAWRPKDRAGALGISPADAQLLGVQNGGRVRITTRRASAEAVVEISDRLQPGNVTLPNGGGLWYPDREGQEFLNGVAPNELTAFEDRDWVAGTPFHKYVPARIEAITG